MAWLSLPEDEHDYARLIDLNLCSLGGYVEDFEQAVELAGFLEAERSKITPEERRAGDRRYPKFMHWRMLSAKAAAISVFNFDETIRVIDRQLGHCKTILKLADKPKLKEARKTFAKSFSGVTGVRASVAHGGALWRTPEAAAEHCIPGMSGSMGFMMTNDRIWTSINGEPGSILFNRQAVDALNEALGLYYAGFEPVSTFTIERHLELSRGRVQPPQSD
jgi:hypothetical protein